MKVWRAVVLGIVGCVIVVAAVALAGLASGPDANLCTLIGAALIGRADTTATILGAIAQLVIAVVAALAYAVIFEWITRRAGLLIGLAIAAGHVMIAGLAMGFVPAGRMIAAGIQPPGAFLEYRGIVVMATFVLAHFLFGALVGGCYGETRHRVPTSNVRWRDVPAPDALELRQ